MKFLKPAKNQQAFAKVGFFGFQGSGKTHTAMLIAQGLCDLTSNRRMAFFDTETGSDWFSNRLEGYEFLQIKSRAFSDLLGTIKEAESEGVCVLVIDSITHVWREILDAYMRQVNRKRLMFSDWGPIKTEWARYTDLFINSKLHIIVCGRAGNVYDYVEGEDGKKELRTTGTKMKAESEFGFEPSLVIEMEAVRGSDLGAGLKNIAHVVKDRSNTINGKSFEMPTFKSFKPHFDSLCIGGEHCGVDTSRSSDDLFDAQGDNQYFAESKARNIALDELKEELIKHFPLKNAVHQKYKSDMLEALFSTRSWERISGGHFKAEEIQWALLKARWFLNEIDGDSKMDVLNAGVKGGKITDPNAAVEQIRLVLKNQFPED